jgi:hypothetical protein
VPVRIVFSRDHTATVELRITADDTFATLTCRTLRRDDPLDLPHAVVLQIPIGKLSQVIAGLEAARAAAASEGRG